MPLSFYGESQCLAREFAHLDLRICHWVLIGVFVSFDDGSENGLKSANFCLKSHDLF